MTALRNAIRSLRHSPAFAFTVVLTLALGIGLNDAIFTVVDCVLLRPLGYRDADRLVSLCTVHYPNFNAQSAVAGDDFVDLAHDVHDLESAAFYSSEESGVRVGNNAAYLRVAAVSPSFAEVMGVTPLAGRLFRSTENVSTHAATEALVGAVFARDHFGSATAALGQTVHAGPLTRVIVGVLPDGFSFPQNTAVWVEVGSRPETTNRTAYNQAMVAKRRVRTTPQELAAELDTEAHRLAASYPEDGEKRFLAVPLADEVVGRVRPTLRLLMGAVSVMLLIVCTNLLHLQLVRGTRRLHGVAVRKALGASRVSGLMEALLESVLLAAAGAICAALIAFPALKILVRFAPAGMPRLSEISLNSHVFLFSVAVSTGLMAVTAMFPGWQAWTAAPASTLRQNTARGMEARSARSLRSSLLVVEVALTLMLSAAALLLTRQMIRQAHTDLGFSPERLLTLDIHMTAETPLPEIPDHGSAEEKAAALQAAAAVAHTWTTHLDAVLQTVRTTPGVRSVDAIDGAPMGFGAPDVLYAIRGRQAFDFQSAKSLPDADVHAVTPAFFSTIGVPLLRGRGLAEQDMLLAPPAVLINASLAHQQFPGQDPVGKQIICGYERDPRWWTIVGVVGDLRSDAPGKPVTPTFYVPLAQHPQKATDPQFVVRTATDPSALMETLHRKLKQQYPDIAVKATTMTQNIAETERLEHLRSLLFGSFAAVSLFLAGLGIYGVTAYSVAQRRFEFGLRLAVGAERRQLLNMVLGETLRLALAGTVLGSLAALGLTKVLGSVVGELPAFDAHVYASAVLILLGLATLAALLPAQRAAGTEPMEVLRYE